ncbi:allophanate hydrolase [Alkalicoccus luteus]|uniref:Allophanate hydrolase n=1 Tax=Alkalicoccus luteus TaxID=1237094 RepID=A0A969PPI3_9BACI|nr:allophanate hydrolase [Alkalicoccus luteus]NJP36046.1 allophanate hydrolase [Alkalicoccus luteus]
MTAHTIAVLRAQYIEGTRTPEEVIDELVQAAADDPGNIWIDPPKMEALQPYLDALHELNPEEAPLWGIPFAVKDNIDVGGMPTTAGAPAYAYTPAEHAPVVADLIRAGAIPVGKTNLDQFATGLVGTRSPYGETHNTLKPELISGGSSSGSAAAVASGQVPFALGTDTAGSGRIPAALNGLYGWKASLGAWSTRGVVPACESLDCVTAFARTMEDVTRIDHVVRRYDPEHAWSRPLADPAVKKPERIFVPEEAPSFFGPYADAYRKAWERALKQAETLGIPVETLDTSGMEAVAEELYSGPFVAERWAALGAFTEQHPGAVHEVTEAVLRTGEDEKHSAASLFQAQHRTEKEKAKTKQALSKSVLMLPTAGGTWSRDEVRQNPISTNSQMGAYTNHCNLLDLSAIALPAGEAAADVPFGVTFFATAEEEGLLFAVGQAWENAKADTMDLIVCGLHMRGYPLASQLEELGGTFVEEVTTAPAYQLYKLPTEPAKPGLIRSEQNGSAIEAERWRLPVDRFGELLAHIPAPLGIGSITLNDESTAPGFLCEAYAAKGAEDITTLGSWHRVTQKGYLSTK